MLAIGIARGMTEGAWRRGYAICNGKGGLLDNYGSNGLARAAPGSESINNDDVVVLHSLIESGLTIGN